MERNISHITSERGAAGPKLIIALIIVAAVIYAAIQLIPIYWDHWNFEDDMKTQVRFLFVNVNQKRKEYLTDYAVKRLKEFGAKYDEKKGVMVEVDDPKKKAKVEIWYSRPHKLPLYPNPIQFYIKVESTTIESL